ncbi:40S ribosomal protein S29-like [Felis catus]|uniref:40S ribosomal protein S29-like n=1 Tax=Felis catus TaxID=9685 RepID=UPI001D19D7F3|nr:40S ribosomal protein S29-like [Felis catus]
MGLELCTINLESLPLGGVLKIAMAFCLIVSESKMGHQQLYWSHLRKFGQGSHSCCICWNQQGLTQKYTLSMCCQYFRQSVKDIGFIRLH